MKKVRTFRSLNYDDREPRVIYADIAEVHEYDGATTRYEYFSKFAKVTFLEFLSDDEKKHYMRLFAAAPELYKACKEFVRKVESGAAHSVRSYAQMKKALAKIDKDDS